MLSSTRKIYVVYEYGGQWEDAYHTNLFACVSQELADKHVARLRAEHAAKDPDDDVYYDCKGYDVRELDVFVGDE